MNRERIIQRGSAREKIRLLYTDVAYKNSKDALEDIIATPRIRTKKRRVNTPRRRAQEYKVLSKAERQSILNTIKDPKGLEYYRELRAYNRSFLMFRNIVSDYVSTFGHLSYIFVAQSMEQILHIRYENTINIMINSVEDKKLRETLIGIALRELKTVSIRRSQESLKIDAAEIDNRLKVFVAMLNVKTKEAKMHIETLKTFLDKHLPLKPYKDYLIEAEDKIKDDIEDCIEVVEETITNPTAEFNILRWEEVEVEVDEVDIENIKNVGL